MTVHTVIFDAGLTLLQVAPSFWDVFVRGCERAGVVVEEPDDVAAVLSLYREHDASWRDAGRPSPHIGDGVAEREFWRGLYARYLSALEVEGDHEHATAAIYDAFQEPGVFVPFPDVDEALDDLEARGVRLAIVSNWGPWLRGVLAHAAIVHRFEAIVVSGEEGIEKPDRRIFDLALARLDLEPSEAIAYVGDDLEADVAGSSAAGLTPVLIDRLERHAAHVGRRIVSLADLGEVIDLPAPA